MSDPKLVGSTEIFLGISTWLHINLDVHFGWLGDIAWCKQKKAEKNRENILEENMSCQVILLSGRSWM